MKTLQALILLLFSTFFLRAQTVPDLMNYQGILADPTGAPLPDGEYTLTFSIWESEAGGGSPVWGGQVLPAVPLVSGRFNVMLGRDSNSVPITAAFTRPAPANAYIEISVQGSAGPRTTILPRQRILTAPFAFRSGAAENADKLEGLKWDAVFSSGTTNRIPGGKIETGTISQAQLATDSVGPAQLANASVGPTEIAPASIASSHIQSPLTGPLILSASVASPMLTVINNNSAASAAVYVEGSPPPASSSLSVRSFGSGPALKVVGGGVRPGQFQTFPPAIRAQGYNGANVVELASADGLAGYFGGPVDIDGEMNGAAKFFKIDHPLDPANKYLYHASVESPDMKNVYDGVITLNNQGEATVSLPPWFDALNKDIRYQLTPIGAPGPNIYIAAEVNRNQFTIAGGPKGLKVSWQVTGIRKDPWAVAHPIKVEASKSETEQGHYIHPELHGQPKEKSIAEARRKNRDKSGK